MQIVSEEDRQRLIDICDKHGWNCEVLISFARALDEWLYAQDVKKPVESVAKKIEVKKYLTDYEVMEILNLSQSQLNRYTKLNRLPYIHGKDMYDGDKIAQIAFARKYPDKIENRPYDLDELTLYTQRSFHVIENTWYKVFHKPLPWLLTKAEVVKMIKAFHYSTSKKVWNK